MVRDLMAPETSETDLLCGILDRGRVATVLASISVVIFACASAPPRRSLERAADAEVAGSVRAALFATGNICGAHRYRDRCRRGSSWRLCLGKRRLSKDSN